MFPESRLVLICDISPQKRIQQCIEYLQLQALSETGTRTLTCSVWWLWLSPNFALGKIIIIIISSSSSSSDRRHEFMGLVQIPQMLCDLGEVAFPLWACLFTLLCKIKELAQVLFRGSS